MLRRDKIMQQMIASGPSRIPFNTLGATKGVNMDSNDYDTESIAPIPDKEPYRITSSLLTSTKKQKDDNAIKSSLNETGADKIPYIEGLKYANDVEKDFISPVAAHFNIDPVDLRHVLLIESSGDPTRFNTSKKGAGLIQFYRDSRKDWSDDKASWYKTIRGKQHKIQDIAKMTPAEQAKLAIGYFSEVGLKSGASFDDLYFKTFYPEAYGKDNNYVMGSKQGKSFIKSIAKDNAHYDKNGDGKITVEELYAQSRNAVRTMSSRSNVAEVNRIKTLRNRSGLMVRKKKGGILY